MADNDLFRNYVKDVRPITDDTVVSVVRRSEFPKRLEENKGDLSADDFTLDFLEVEPNTSLLFSRSGLSPKVIKQLKKGLFSVENSLDLHLLTVLKARLSLINFLNCSFKQGMRCVCIVHGKGLHSVDGKAVLKSAVNDWLRKIDDVLAFCSAKNSDGGVGALYVLLRRSRARKNFTFED